jgi:hypothetical protein
MRITEMDGRVVPPEQGETLLQSLAKPVPGEAQNAPQATEPKAEEPKAEEPKEVKAEPKQEEPEWLQNFLADVNKPAQEQQQEEEAEPVVELTEEEKAKLETLPPEIQQKVREFQNALNAKNASKWRKIWAKAKQAEAEAAAMRQAIDALRSTGLPPQAPPAVPNEPVPQRVPQPPAPGFTPTEEPPDTTLLPEFKALQEAEPEEYHKRLADYERARNKAIAEWIARQRQLQEAQMSVQRQVLETDAALTKEWTGDLIHPIPWTEVKALFEKVAQEDRETYMAVASAKGSPRHRAEFMAAVVASRFPDVYARRLAEAQQKYRSRPADSAQTKDMAQALQGGASSQSRAGAPANSKSELAKAWLQYVGK